MTGADASVKTQGAHGDEIDVSVLLVTYNHADYVGTAIQSVLDQRTDRSFELIISEDASTDSTRAIVQDMAQNDKRIRTLLSAENLRSNEPLLRALRVARGRYVCLLDGDDRWIARDKIERQAALLDAHPEASACFHNALIMRGNELEPTDERWTKSSQSSRTSFRQLWEGNPFATAAGMLRRETLAGVGEWYVDCFPYTDWPLYLLCAEHGDLMFVDEPVAVYRLHEGGEFSGQSTQGKLRLTARFYRHMMRIDGGRWSKAARRGAAEYFGDWATEYQRSGNRDLARLCARLALRLGPIARPIRQHLRLLRQSLA